MSNIEIENDINGISILENQSFVNATVLTPVVDEKTFKLFYITEIGEYTIPIERSKNYYVKFYTGNKINNGNIFFGNPDIDGIPESILSSVPLSQSECIGKDTININVSSVKVGKIKIELVEKVVSGGGGTDKPTDLGLGAITEETLEITSSTGTSAVLPSATETEAGLMSSADKTKLDNITPGETLTFGEGFKKTDNLVELVLDALKGIAVGDDGLFLKIDDVTIGFTTSDIQGLLKVNDASLDDTQLKDKGITNAKIDVSTLVDGTTTEATTDNKIKAIGGGTGKETNLSTEITADSIKINNDNGTGVNLFVATETSAGIVTASDKQKIDNAIQSADFASVLYTALKTQLKEGSNITFVTDDTEKTITINAITGGEADLYKLNPKQSVVATSTVDITAGSSIAGDIITLANNGVLTIDGYSAFKDIDTDGKVADIFSNNCADSILLTNETTKTSNGVYFVKNKGSVSTKAKLQRRSDGVTGSQLMFGSHFLSVLGNENKGLFYLENLNPITIGTTELVFKKLPNGSGEQPVHDIYVNASQTELNLNDFAPLYKFYINLEGNRTADLNITLLNSESELQNYYIDNKTLSKINIISNNTALGDVVKIINPFERWIIDYSETYFPPLKYVFRDVTSNSCKTILDDESLKYPNNPRDGDLLFIQNGKTTKRYNGTTKVWDIISPTVREYRATDWIYKNSSNIPFTINIVSIGLNGPKPIMGVPAPGQNYMAYRENGKNVEVKIVYQQTGASETPQPTHHDHYCISLGDINKLVDISAFGLSSNPNPIKIGTATFTNNFTKCTGVGICYLEPTTTDQFYVVLTTQIQDRKQYPNGSDVNNGGKSGYEWGQDFENNGYDMRVSNPSFTIEIDLDYPAVGQTTYRIDSEIPQGTVPTVQNIARTVVVDTIKPSSTILAPYDPNTQTITFSAIPDKWKSITVSDFVADVYAISSADPLIEMTGIVVRNVNPVIQLPEINGTDFVGKTYKIYNSSDYILDIQEYNGNPLADTFSPLKKSEMLIATVEVGSTWRYNVITTEIKDNSMDKQILTASAIRTIDGKTY